MKMQSWAKILSIFLAGVHEHLLPPQPEIGMLRGPALLWGEHSSRAGGSRSLGALAVGLKSLEQ